VPAQLFCQDAGAGPGLAHHFILANVARLHYPAQHGHVGKEMLS
jgi:hypothetical protein